MRSNCFPVDTCCFHLYTEHSEITAQGRDIGVCVVEYIGCEYVSDFDTCFFLFADRYCIIQQIKISSRRECSRETILYIKF